MAVIQEIIQPEVEGGWVLVRNYSDRGMMIIQDGTGDMYAEAIDPQFTNRTYTESDIPIDSEEGEEEDETGEEKAPEVLDALLGE